MKKWFTWLVIVALIFTITGCSTEDGDVSAETKITTPTTEETEPPILTYDSIEYWEIIEDEIVSMLNQHNLYVSTITHGYPCVQIYVEPGIMTDDGKILASGLSLEEYEGVFESVKVELHKILDNYKLAKPKSALHGCHSVLDIFFMNWVINENKVYDNVYSRDVACYGLDLLEYYYEYEENTYIKKNALINDVWSKYPVFKQ